MAKNSFLSDKEWLIAEEVLRPPVVSPRGNLRARRHFSNEAFSRWLELRLDTELRKHPLWEESAPIALGSYARGNLCPNSDVDLLFVGEEGAVISVVQDLNERGFKIRYRVPENREDWTQGVEPFDVLALLSARPLESSAARDLFIQQERIWSQGQRFSKSLIQTMAVEREQRSQRYDSIDNFLEPNVKYGSGGLRDIQQTLMVYELAQDRFPQVHHPLEVLRYYQSFFLTLRQRLHLMGHSDVLRAQEQMELSEWFQYEEAHEFMREIQKGLSRVSFYTDWFTQVALASQASLESYSRKKMGSLKQCFKFLEKDSSVLMQNKIREFLPYLSEELDGKSLGRLLKKALSVSYGDKYIVSLFRSHLIQHCFPDIKRLTGWVQHDQYHRFTADTHIMQTLREVYKVYKSPKKLLGEIYKFSAFRDIWKDRDWQILMWVALYHDIAKGLKGDHALIGKKMVEKDLKKFGFNQSFINEVSWMVEHHLLLSEAAFRKNPESPQTWQVLSDKGINKGLRLLRLGIFTMIDIRATNPEAWNSWKERLLYDLMKTMEENSTKNFLSLKKLGEKKQVKVEPIFNIVDKTVMAQVPVGILLQESQDLEEKGSCDNLPPLLVRQGQNHIWIRLHDHTGAKGVLADFVAKLYLSGCSVRHACINSHKKFGAYDWFQVKTGKSVKQLQNILNLDFPEKIQLGDIYFDQILITHRDDNEIIVSFRGRDQQGLLVTAVNELFSWGLEVQWARVHTWGRQIDDVFSISPHPEIDDIIDELVEKFQLK